MATDQQALTAKGLTAPIDTWLACTPGTPFDSKPRAIICNGAGDVSMTDSAGTTIIFTLLAGVIYPMRPNLINSSGTTATGIKLLY